MHDLDSGWPLEQLMHPAIDLPHATATQWGLDAILADGLADEIRHVFTSNSWLPCGSTSQYVASGRPASFIGADELLRPLSPQQVLALCPGFCYRRQIFSHPGNGRCMHVRC